jgi:hypothetical protein
MTSLPRFLNGPKFVAWLISEGINKRDVTESQNRRWHDWEKGSRADVYATTTDQLLTDHYLHALIPDDVWALDQQPSPRGPKKDRINHATQTVQTT